MKTLEKDELYQNLHGFLKRKGVQLAPGSYSETIQKGCALLSDAINAGAHGLSRTKDEVDKKLDQLRQIIHEKTAPPGSATPPPCPPPDEPKTSSTRNRSAKRQPPRKRTKKRSQG